MPPPATDDRLALLRAIVSVARADGEVGDAERERIQQLSEFLRLGTTQQAAVEEMLEDPSPPALPDPSELPAYEVRLYVFQQVLAMVYADGVVKDAERARTEELARALRLEPEHVNVAWRRAGEISGAT